MFLTSHFNVANKRRRMRGGRGEGEQTDNGEEGGGRREEREGRRREKGGRRRERNEGGKRREEGV